MKTHISIGSPRRRYYLLLLIITLSGCGPVDHFLIHPREHGGELREQEVSFVSGELQVYGRIYSPVALPDSRRANASQTATLAAVLVHPEAGAGPEAMRGVCIDLAREGMVVMAAGYRRLEGGNYRRTLIPWREPSEISVSFRRLQREPGVDPRRIGLLGFSQGSVFSLLIAAAEPESVRAVVAYYPVTDFNRWLDPQRYRFPRSFAFRLVRRHFFRKTGLPREEAGDLLAEASPMTHVERIEAPVLLIHGEKDDTAPVEESERLAVALESADREVELVTVPGADHLFNFTPGRGNRARAMEAWERTLIFLKNRLLLDVNVHQ